MSILDKIHKGGDPLPNNILLAGPEGIGKTTFGAASTDPIFICAEQGLLQFPEIPRFVPETDDEIKSFLREILALEKPPYGTVVFDTTDWLERLIHSSLCVREEKTSIEKIGGGYGKGYNATAEIMKAILAICEQIREKHRIRTVLLGHVHVRAHHDPTLDESYDRYELKGHKTFTGMLREWPDVCLFATRQLFKRENKAPVAGDHIMHTEWSIAFDAKNRMALPPTLPLDFAAFLAAEEDCSPEALRVRFKALYEERKDLIPEAEAANWESAYKKADKLGAIKLRKAVTILQNLEAEPASE